MDQERRRRFERLFHSVLAQKPERRHAFLDTECGGDTELQRQVEPLLAKSEDTATLIETPAVDYMTLKPMLTAISPGVQFGPYRIIAPLGVGGMGEVYRAHDSKLGRDVAIKILPAKFALDPERLARFRGEARTLASLNHPNIAAIYGLESSGDVDFLVLELVEGDTLRGPLPIKRALDYARQAAEALEAAHEKGIIHRDLKPANIKVTPQGRVKVLDFGLAKAIYRPEWNQDLSPATVMSGTETRVGYVLGTPGYMSPEQRRGQTIDQRTDIWAFGCLLYELLTGRRAFHGDSNQDTITAVPESEPDWQALPPKTPTRIRDLLRHCLQKRVGNRLSRIADARSVIERVQRGANRWQAGAISATGLALLAVSAALWLRDGTHRPGRSEWVQLTKFPDSVSQPALSPNGRMVAFIRGPDTFVGPGEVYVKSLPDGEPVQLTHDKLSKMSPAFSPDGARIAYTGWGKGSNGDTWVVPIWGGEPRLWLKNASALAWTGPRDILFSEIKVGNHMAIVAAQEKRIGARDVYLPAEQAGMAHRSYLSPNEQWVLLVEMDEEGRWVPCRVVPMDGSTTGRRVGPSGGACTAGAWSPEGKSVYLTSNVTGAYHIWRQRFPNGRPEQITSGPTEEEGIAMMPDGRSFITAVALQNTALWIHHSGSDRGISVEGDTAQPRFTPDGGKLCYRKFSQPPHELTGYGEMGELSVADLGSGRSEPLAPGFRALDYDISVDGRQVVMEAADGAGKSRLWRAPLNRSSPPSQVPNVEGSGPRFGPGGEIFFRHVVATTTEGSIGYIYRVHADGTGLRQAFERPVRLIGGVSPDGQWLWATVPIEGSGLATTWLFPVDGGPAVPAGDIDLNWSPDGKFVAISSDFPAVVPADSSYLIPLPRGQALPPIPTGGFRSEQQIVQLPGARRIDAPGVTLGPAPDVYAFYRRTAQRNLYRIPLP